MAKFNARYFLTRVALAGLLTLGVVIFLDQIVVKTQSVVTTHHEDVSTTDVRLAEKAYWDTIYDYHKVKVHTKQYRFGKLVSETWRYMDGREVVQGLGKTELGIFEGAAVGLIFMVVFSMLPIFLRRP